MTEEKQDGAGAEERHSLFGGLVDRFVSAIAHKDAHAEEEPDEEE